MFAEEKLKNYKNRCRIDLFKYHTSVHFDTIEDAYEFDVWLKDNNYQTFGFLQIVNFYKKDIHAHRLQDALKYPQLKLLSVFK